MDTESTRTIHDFLLAIRRSAITILVFVIAGGLIGYVLRPVDGLERSTVTIRLEDRTSLASTLELSPDVLTAALPSIVKTDFEARQDELLPDLPDGVVISIDADDIHHQLDVTAESDSVQDSTESVLVAADAIRQMRQTDQSERIATIRSFHEDRVEALGAESANAASDTDRAVLLVEQADHLDTLSGLAQLELLPLDAFDESAVSRSSTASNRVAIRTILLGALLGLIIAIAVVYARMLNDHSVRRAVDLESTSGAATLATTPAGPTVPVTLMTPVAAAIARFAEPGSAHVLVAAVTVDDDARAVAAALDQALDSLGSTMTCKVAGSPLSADAGLGVIGEALHASTTILVATYGRTTTADAQAALRSLETAGAGLMGFVLASVPPRELSWSATSGTRPRPPEFRVSRDAHIP